MVSGPLKITDVTIKATPFVILSTERVNVCYLPSTKLEYSKCLISGKYY